MACAPKDTACWLDPHCRDVARLRTDRIDAAGDHVVNRARVDVVALEQATPARRAEVDGMHARQASVALANRGAYSVDDVRLSHVRLLLS